jgi:hypothetical protein
MKTFILPIKLFCSSNRGIPFFIAKLTKRTHWKLSILIQKSSVSDLFMARVTATNLNRSVQAVSNRKKDMGVDDTR